MNTLRLTSGYLPFSTLAGRYPSFFWVRVPIGPNFGIFWAITLVKKMSDWAEIWSIVSSHKYLRYISCFLRNSNFLRPQDVLKVCSFWCNLGPIYPMKESEINKSKYSPRKNLSIGLSKYSKIRALSGPNFELLF